MTDAGAERLAQAIVNQACKDWKKAVRDLYVSDYDNKDAIKRQRECERFFRSDWCYGLTGVSSKVIIELLWRTQE